MTPVSGTRYRRQGFVCLQKLTKLLNIHHGHITLCVHPLWIFISAGYTGSLAVGKQSLQWLWGWPCDDPLFGGVWKQSGEGSKSFRKGSKLRKILNQHIFICLIYMNICLFLQKMCGHLRLLNIACAAKAKPRLVTLTKPSRDSLLAFSLLGGQEKGFRIFIDAVEPGSKAAEVGLKRGDQVWYDLIVAIIPHPNASLLSSITIESIDFFFFHKKMWFIFYNIHMLLILL